MLALWKYFDIWIKSSFSLLNIVRLKKNMSFLFILLFLLYIILYKMHLYILYSCKSVFHKFNIFASPILERFYQNCYEKVTILKNRFSNFFSTSNLKQKLIWLNLTVCESFTQSSSPGNNLLYGVVKRPKRCLFLIIRCWLFV